MIGLLNDEMWLACFVIDHCLFVHVYTFCTKSWGLVVVRYLISGLSKQNPVSHGEVEQDEPDVLRY